MLQPSPQPAYPHLVDIHVMQKRVSERERQTEWNSNRKESKTNIKVIDICEKSHLSTFEYKYRLYMYVCE